MLDGAAKTFLDPVLDRMGRALAQRSVTANAVTLFGLIIGLLAASAIAFGSLGIGLMLILASRLCDGLDGAVARVNGKSDLGGYFDIVADFAFYGAIPFAFVLFDPQANGIAGAVLILSFYVNGASFLAYAIMAEKQKLSTEARGQKSLYFTTGLAEATETLVVFCLMCLLPAQFATIAFIFAAICFYTTLSRVVLAAKTFR